MSNTQKKHEGTFATAEKGKKHRITNTNETKSQNSDKTGIKPYLCGVCGMRFFTKSSYDRHFRTHTGENPFNCQYCEKTFSRSESLKDHINTHLGLKPYNCNVCNDSFSSRTYLSRHIKNHTNEQTQPHVFHPGHYPITILTEKYSRRYECNICKKKFKTEYTIMCHFASFTEVKSFHCELCEKRFLTSRKLESHLQSAHKDECTFKCFECKMGFPQQDYLLDHIVNNHTPGSKRFKCKLCNYGSNYHSKLKEHMIKHTNEQPYTCPKRNKKYKSASTLRVHEKRHNEPTLACPQCDEVFKVKDDLRRHHKRRHYEGDRQHVCQHCGVTIVKKSQLERHLRIHEQEDKTGESYKNDLDPISQDQHNNLRNNTQETEVNVNTQGTSQTLEIQGTLEASLSPAADIKDPVADFGDMTYNEVWSDSQSVSTLHDLDWSLLDDLKKQPETMVADSVAAAEKMMITSAPVKMDESTHFLLAFFPMDHNAVTISHNFAFNN